MCAIHREWAEKAPFESLPVQLLAAAAMMLLYYDVCENVYKEAKEKSSFSMYPHTSNTLESYKC